MIEIQKRLAVIAITMIMIYYLWKLQPLSIFWTLPYGSIIIFMAVVGGNK